MFLFLGHGSKIEEEEIGKKGRKKKAVGRSTRHTHQIGIRRGRSEKNKGIDFSFFFYSKALIGEKSQKEKEMWLGEGGGGNEMAHRQIWRFRIKPGHRI